MTRRARRQRRTGWRGWHGIPSAAVVGQGDTAFSPLSLGPFLFLDVSDLSTLKVERTGASAPTPAVVDGPVGSMRDLASGIWFTAASDAARPTLRNSGNLYWLEFDGSNDFLSATFVQTQPLDRVMAFREITWGDGDTLWDGLNGGSGNAARFYQSGASPAVKAFAGSEVELNDDPAIDADAVITERWSGASSRWAFDNGSYLVADAGANNPGGLVLGAFGDLTQAFANFRFYGGVTKSAFTDPEIAQLRTYLAAKQGRVL